MHFVIFVRTFCFSVLANLHYRSFYLRGVLNSTTTVHAMYENLLNESVLLQISIRNFDYSGKCHPERPLLQTIRVHVFQSSITKITLSLALSAGVRLLSHFSLIWELKHRESIALYHTHLA